MNVCVDVHLKSAFRLSLDIYFSSVMSAEVNYYKNASFFTSYAVCRMFS